MRGGLTTYRLSGGRVSVKARSSIHDTTTLFPKLSGELGVDPEDPAQGATARVAVDMREFDAGDRMKNWKLKSDLEPDKHPEAVFALERLEGVTRDGDRVRATAIGTLRWRGREVAVRAQGTGTITAGAVQAEATFPLDVRDLGVTPPKFLMFKMEPEVLVTVQLSATAA